MVKLEDMASASSSDTPSQSTRKFTYDVFLSFRGEDTRKNIVDHLYHWLEQKGLHTFKDDQRLEKGQSINPTLLEAIQQSRLSLVVFSKNYASSTWCLDELAKIIECRDNLNQVVVPIFYDIEPSHVRKQTGSFKEAFAKHEENEGKGRVERWRKALTEAGSIAGHDLHGHEYNGFETVCIKAVIADILKQLPPPPSVQKGLVGLEPRLEEIRMKLKVCDVNVKLILALWGMGGIGKTTIARAAFERFSSAFDGSCFLADVRKHEMEALQKKLLSNVLKENSINIDDVDKGFRMIQERLKWKRVLIVLDDVDHDDQLYKLVGDGEWLCNGSRVIITTRDKHLFTQFSIVVEPYEVEKLDEEKALELFSWHAFKKESPEKGFKNLCTSFVAHAGGLPLALKVWGSFLRGQTKQTMWENTLENIKDIPEGKVIEMLKISYDGLGEECKNVFLDIVCFFRYEDRYVVEEVLNCCKLHPDINISVLIDRCLLFESSKYIEMHDLIYEMGVNIAREKGRRRCRLEDLEEDLEDEPKVVEGLLLSFDCDENISHCIEYFKQMTKLKMLIVEYQEHYHCSSESHLKSIEALKETGIMNYLPRSLMVLKFRYYPWSMLFFPMEMKKLTYLDLSHSKSLLETPNFANIPNLMNLNLSYCEELKTIHPSFENLRKLVKLSLLECSNLAKFPSFNQEMKSITSLDLSGCSLIETPNFAMMPNLKELQLSSCEKLKEIHPSFENLTELEKFCSFGCSTLEKLPNINKEMKSIKSLDLSYCRSLLETPTFAMMPNLRDLRLSHCKKLKEIHPSFENLTELENFCYDGCSTLEKLPNINKEMKSITHLKLQNCYSLVETPKFAMIPNLKELRLLDCEKLKEIHPSFENLTELEELYIEGCSTLEMLPDINKEMKSITHLEINNCCSLLETPKFAMMPNLKELQLLDCEKLKEIHPSFENLTELEELYIEGCSTLEMLTDINKEMKSITHLEIRNCCSLLETPKFAMMPNLKELRLLDCEKLKEIHPSFENPTELEQLYIEGCSTLEKLPNIDKNLKKLRLLNCAKLKEIHPSFENLTELEELYIEGCSTLEMLPDINKEMKSIRHLKISNCCSLLETPKFAMMPNLKGLRLLNCEKLKEIHPSFENLTELVELYIEGCSTLEMLPDINKEMKSITRLELENCCSLLETLNFAMMLNLKTLQLSKCEKLKEIHPSFGNLTELEELCIDGCSTLEKLPNINKEMKMISCLKLQYCRSLLETPNFAMMPNLEILRLSGCEKLKEIHPSFGNLTELEELYFDGCSNLEKLPNINKEMKKITCLDLKYCRSLLETPNFAMMPNLKVLNLFECKKLKEIHTSFENLTKLKDLVFDGCSNLEKLPNINKSVRN